MASADDVYLPDLAKVFDREATVFSWKTILNTIREPDAPLRNVFPATASTLLSKPVPSFPAPSQQSRNTFETKTAAINVTPSPEQSYSIKDIKEDTTWLSSEVEISEEEALRVTVLEWEQRPTLRLLTGYTDAELASLKDALSSGDMTEDVDRIFPKRSDDDFDTSRQRRKRLLLCYFREAQALLEVSKELQQIALLPELENSRISKPITALAKELDKTSSPDDGVGALLDAIDHKLKSLDTGRDWTIELTEITDAWAASELQQIRLILEVVLLRKWASSEPSTPGETVLQWFRIAAGCQFFTALQPSRYLSSSQVDCLQATAALVSLAVLDPASAIAYFAENATPTDSQAFYLQHEMVTELHSILLSAAEACIPQAAPAALGWAMMLDELRRASLTAKDSREGHRALEQSPSELAGGRRASYGSLQQSLYEDVMDHIINASPVSDPVAYMIRCTIEADHAFEVIATISGLAEQNISLLSTVKLQILQELVTISVATLGYTPECLSAQFAILASPLNAHTIYQLKDQSDTFIKNEFLMDNVFAVAAARFPYESLPFLKLCKLLASAKIFDESGSQYIACRLRLMDSFTQIAKDSFTSYHTIREDENLNLVALEFPASMISNIEHKQLALGENQFSSTILPADTIGEVISESQPPIIKWRHSYSGIALLGSWLELHYFGQLHRVISSFEPAEDVATTIIELLSALLGSALDTSEDIYDEHERREHQNALIREASIDLQNGADIADYVFEIMEQELQAYRRRPSNTFNTSLLVACIDFLSNFAQIRPTHFWASMIKSSLLESYGMDSFLMTLIAGIEVPSQMYPLLEACTNLYRRIVTITLHCSWQPDSNGGFMAAKSKSIGIQRVKVQTSVLDSLTRSLYGVFESMSGWTFSSMLQRTQIVRSLSTSFERTIIYAYGVGETTSLLGSSFRSAGDFLVKQSRPGLGESIGAVTLLQHLVRAAEVEHRTADSIILEQIAAPFSSLLGLAQVVAAYGKQKALPASSFELQMLDSIPLLVRILTTSPEYTTTTLLLIKDLLELVAHSKPVSLLGYLGSVSSMSFLIVLKDLQSSSQEVETQAAVWKLVTNFVGTNQQWLALIILTGSPPEKVKTDSKDANHFALRGKTFMQTALNRLVKIADISSPIAVAMLEFTVQAQQNWSWTSNFLTGKKDFLPALATFVRNTFIDSSAVLQIAFRNKIASLLTDLTTTYLYHARANQEKDQIKTIESLLGWLAETAIEVQSYKSSLHANLPKNFASRFPGLEASNFKRTGLTPSDYGDQYYYDLSFADEVLHDKQYWYHQGNSDQSFFAEFRRANLNFSVVDSELRLLHSFQAFCTEHSGWLASQQADKTSAKSEASSVMLAQIVHRCLTANMHVYPPNRLFDNLFQSRANLAIALLQKLVDVKAKGFEFKALLRTAWDCARFRNSSYEQAIVNSDLEYWRLCLIIVLLSMQFHAGGAWIPPVTDHSNSNLLRHALNDQIPATLEIISVVIGQGFKTIINAIQDQRRSDTMTEDQNITVAPKDITLVSNMLETTLRMTRAPEFVSEASERLISSGIIQSCLVLYSWSHTLIDKESDEEPTLSNDCLQLLCTLSTLPPVTEEMAVEGVLSRLLNGHVIQRLQNVPDGASHLDKRPHCHFLYKLWATGLLPLCMNILHTVGAPVAAEVSVFMNQFPKQLICASSTFISVTQFKKASDAVSLTSASEVATLALISFILESYRTAGASAAVDSSTILQLRGFDEHRKALAEDISDVINMSETEWTARVVPTNDRELGMSRSVAGNQNLLVKKVREELSNALLCLKWEAEEDDK